MSLDFTALNSIQGAKNGIRKPLEYVDGNLAIQPQKPVTGQNNGNSGQAESRPVHPLESERIERERIRQMYATHQQNIRKAGTLRSDITKGIQGGEDPLRLLLKALECIGLMTGDMVTFTQNKEDLLAIYGRGLKNPASLKVELEEAQNRLEMLTRPELITGDTPPDAKKRIENAVTAHRKLIERLEQEIVKGGKE